MRKNFQFLAQQLLEDRLTPDSSTVLRETPSGMLYRRISVETSLLFPRITPQLRMMLEVYADNITSKAYNIPYRGVFHELEVFFKDRDSMNRFEKALTTFDENEFAEWKGKKEKATEAQIDKTIHEEVPDLAKRVKSLEKALTDTLEILKQDAEEEAKNQVPVDNETESEPEEPLPTEEAESPEENVEETEEPEEPPAEQESETSEEEVSNQDLSKRLDSVEKTLTDALDLLVKEKKKKSFLIRAGESPRNLYPVAPFQPSHELVPKEPLILDVDRCPSCGKSHNYKLPANTQRGKVMTMVFVCPTDKKEFQVTLTAPKWTERTKTHIT